MKVSARCCVRAESGGLIIFFVYLATLRLLDCNVQSQSPAEKINFHLMEFAPLSSHEPDSIVIPVSYCWFFPNSQVWWLHIGTNGARLILHIWRLSRVMIRKLRVLRSRRLQLLFGIHPVSRFLPYLWKEAVRCDFCATAVSEKLDLAMLLIFQIAAVFLYAFHRKSVD